MYHLGRPIAFVTLAGWVIGNCFGAGSLFLPVVGAVWFTRGTVQEVGGLLGSLVQLSGLVVNAVVNGSVLAHLWSLLMLSFYGKFFLLSWIQYYVGLALLQSALGGPSNL